MNPYIKKIVELHKIHKAIEDKDCNGGGNTPSGDIGYEEIYQFYVKQLKSFAPAESLNQIVIPDTFNDIINIENNVYPNNTYGIWKIPADDYGSGGRNILFSVVGQNGAENLIITGQSINSDEPDI